ITNPLPSSTTGTNVGITFSSSKTDSTFTCSVDGAPFTACTSPLNVTLTDATNPHTFAVHATDACGVPDTAPATVQFTVDSTGPTVSCSGPGPGLDSCSTATFVCTSSETPATFECSLDNAPFTPCTAGTG